MCDQTCMMLKSIVDALVNEPETVSVYEKSGQDTGKRTYYIVLEREQMGQIIGKDGRIANSVRLLVKASAKRNLLETVSLEIIPR